MAFVRYMDDSGSVSTCELSADATVIGRTASCRITIDDETISREHARIEVGKDARITVRDLGSRNKTYVNGQAITETTLVSGDVIRVGDRVLEFIDDSRKRDRIDLSFLTPDRQEPAGTEWIKTKAPLSLTVQQLERLALLVCHPPLTSRPEDVADAALAQLIVDLQADRGFIALRGEGKRDLRLVTHRALRRPAGGSLTPVSQTFVYATVLQQVAGSYPQSSSQIDAKSGYATTAMIAPLTHQGNIVGLIYLDRPLGKKPFTRAALTRLAASGAYVGALMGESTRRLAQVAPREGAAWLSATRSTQAALTPDVQGNDTFSVASCRLPGRCRCGDLFDVIHLDSQRCCVLILDGGGQGMAGLIQAASVRAAVRAALAVAEDSLMDPVQLLGLLNGICADSAFRHVLPCTYLGIDLASGRMSYINAGGSSPLLMVAPGRLVTLDQPSLVLGVDPLYTYETTLVDLPDRFRLVCYSDGLVEAAAGAGGTFSDQRLHDLLLDHEAFSEPEQVVGLITDALEAHLAGAVADDDASVLVVGHG